MRGQAEERVSNEEDMRELNGLAATRAVWNRRRSCAASAGHGRLNRQAISGTESTLGSFPNNRRRGYAHRPRFRRLEAIVDRTARPANLETARGVEIVTLLACKGLASRRGRPPLWNEGRSACRTSVSPNRSVSSAAWVIGAGGSIAPSAGAGTRRPAMISLRQSLPVTREELS